jgi:hypothetical protein
MKPKEENHMKSGTVFEMSYEGRKINEGRNY